MSFIQHTIEYISAFGPAYTLRRLGEKAGEAVFHRWDRAWRESYAPDEAELARQRASQPDCGLISVLIPVYRTEPALLEALLESLAAQTLANWEAVLALSGDRAETAETLARWAERDARFRVIPLAENKGISGNTNAALAAARGEWAVLCDHDDTLPPDALWRIADRAARGGADVIYTDEDKLTPDGRHHTDPHFKPDFSPDNLRSGNYICHLLAARRSLVEAAGGDPAAVGSRILAGRLTEMLDAVGAEDSLPLVKALASLRQAETAAAKIELEKRRADLSEDALRLEREKFRWQAAGAALKLFEQKRAAEIAAGPGTNDEKIRALLKFMDEAEK